MNPINIKESLAVSVSGCGNEAVASDFAQRLGLEMLGEVKPSKERRFPFLMVYDQYGPSLVETGKGAPGPVRADFVSGKVDHRRKFGGGKGQLIAKAVGLKSGITPHVLDGTAGLGRDAFVLASLGCEVTLLERSPVVAELLSAGLEQARLSYDVAPIIALMTMISADSIEWLTTQAEAVADVIYLDPMFPDRDKSSLVKKEMRLFKPLVGGDLDASALLKAALEKARYRVVVKRPRKAPEIEGVKPTLKLEGKSSRYDIYTLKSLEGLRGALSD
ncbi:class I SAM-dependent methyltransferase [Alkalimarinus sediminis]|uniref:Ribosomal RNA small subunit methyltransferase J n=1 Tax=Alkalimarinus sediminis TaxID=1632866 RepID=A0A9E8KR34_9ALTE|nr:class I SAM-dependent methyltransferase [Alkalimarinus sediminis]UZW75562.1 class I SAM-dependent methyltransferase [Alkalimarinus sediminis]